MLFVAIVVALVACLADTAHGHGMLMEPPARNTMWRAGFDSPKDWNDMGLNCGGTPIQWNPRIGKCGLCGDPYTGPRDHEAGGRYAPVDRSLGMCYDSSSHTMPVNVRITSYHKGYFQFRLCVNNDMSKDPGPECLDNGYLLNVTGSQGSSRYDINHEHKEYYAFELDLPAGLTCDQCILQWIYTAGNNYGCDGSHCAVGIGPQENFVNCADIAIADDCSVLTRGSFNAPTVTPTSTRIPMQRQHTLKTTSTTRSTTTTSTTPSTTTTSTTPSTTTTPTTPSTTTTSTTPSTTTTSSTQTTMKMTTTQGFRTTSSPTPMASVTQRTSTTTRTKSTSTLPSTTISSTTDSTSSPITHTQPPATTSSTGSITPHVQSTYRMTSAPTTAINTPTPTSATTPRLTSHGVVCQSTPQYKVLPHMDDWCRDNCLHNVVKYCPATHCVCHNT